jgi:hypothetical protein
MNPQDARASQRKANARLARILASVALVFALGFAAKVWWLSH